VRSAVAVASTIISCGTPAASICRTMSAIGVVMASTDRQRAWFEHVRRRPALLRRVHFVYKN
jgi:hypothetical protein